MATKKIVSQRSPHLKLAPVIEMPQAGEKEVHQDCVNLLRGLLRQAEAGEISGIVYALTKPNGIYSTDIAGLPRRNSTFCIGILEILKAKLIGRVLS